MKDTKVFHFGNLPETRYASVVKRTKSEPNDGVLENWSGDRKDTSILQHSITPLLLQWFSLNAREMPWRNTRDPYAIWVSEIMLQQTQVKTVIPYWIRWMQELPDITSLASASSEKIHKLWEGLGYYTRVRNMQKAAQNILKNHRGVFPERFEEVLALSGIGRYTAGAICSIAFNQPKPLLDGNVIRVLTRVFGISENPREKQTNSRLWSLAEELVKDAHQTECFGRYAASKSKASSKKDFPHCSFLNQSLMELGALICTPRQPQCEQCPIRAQCVAFRENCVAELPNLGERISATHRHFIAFVVQRGEKYLAQQRPINVVNAHLWEFPNFEVTNKKSDSTGALHFSRTSKKPLCTIKHSITRYRISLEVFPAELESNVTAKGQWFTLTELEKLAFPSAHRKILNHLISVV